MATQTFVPSKLYEYIAANRPILAVTSGGATKLQHEGLSGVTLEAVRSALRRRQSRPSSRTGLNPDSAARQLSQVFLRDGRGDATAW